MDEDGLLTIYYFQTSDGQEQEYTETDFDDAWDRAKRFRLKLIERKYQFVTARYISRKSQVLQR